MLKYGSADHAREEAARKALREEKEQVRAPLMYAICCCCAVATRAMLLKIWRLLLMADA